MTRIGAVGNVNFATAFKTPQNMSHTTLLLITHWTKHITQPYLNLKGAEDNPGMYLKKGRRKYVLNHKTITGAGLYFSRASIMASQNYRL